MSRWTAEKCVRRREHRRENAARLAAYKLERGCADCGYDAHSEALDFDHLGDKAYLPSQFLEYAWETLLREIAKCEVVCANCHRVRTAARKMVQA